MGQLYYRNLYKEFFERYPQDATDFYAVSGYVGPDPIQRLHSLPLNSCVIFGLQREKQDASLHNQLQKIHSDKVSIMYAEVLSHAKCYLWLNKDKPIRGLIGSANFSLNGLNNDFRETLMEVERPDLFAIKAYIDLIKEASNVCTLATVIKSHVNVVSAQSDTCELVLYDPRTGQVQPKHGLNWGFANANVNENDGCIAIRRDHIKNFPNLFQPIFFNPDDGHRERKSKEAVEIIWDDGISMAALFEGSQEVDGINYPKQISSIPKKNILGKYLRARLNLPPVSQARKDSEKVTREILERYGRSSISLKLIQPGIYSADFSPK